VNPNSPNGKKFVEKVKTPKKTITIAIVGKYSEQVSTSCGIRMQRSLTRWIMPVGQIVPR